MSLFLSLLHFVGSNWLSLSVGAAGGQGVRIAGSWVKAKITAAKTEVKNLASKL